MHKHSTQSRNTGRGAALLAGAGVALAASALFGGAAPAHAQGSADDAIDEIIVTTARRREESLMDVPLSISVLGGVELERVGAVDIIEIAKQFVEDRKAFGKRIADFQAVAHKFAEMAMMTETARLHTYSTAEMLDAGEDAIQETAMAKVVATENNFKVADLGVHIMGAAGYVQGDMQRLFRDARLGTIGGGTSDILRNVIAQRMEL